jgi:hypothetical protein
MQQAGAFEVLQKEDALKDLHAAIQRAVAAIQSNPEKKSKLQQRGSPSRRMVTWPTLETVVFGAVQYDDITLVLSSLADD